MAYPFTNLIFEGGGIKGIAYVGAMEVLEGRGILGNIKRAGGTSAGAINAVLYGLGYSHAETKKILGELDFKKFLDDSWGVVRDSKRLIDEFGWYRVDFFRDWIAGLIKKKAKNPDATFRGIHDMGKDKGFTDIYMMGKNISQYVYNKETLGFRLDSAKEIAVFRDHAEPPPQSIDGFFSYAWALIQTIMEEQASQHLHGDDWQRTVYIDTLGVKTTEFDLSETRKRALVKSGGENAENFHHVCCHPCPA